MKDNQLQDPADKRQINCDEKLKAVVDGHDQVTGFSINKFLTQHMVEPVPQTALPAEAMEGGGGGGGGGEHEMHEEHPGHIEEDLNEEEEEEDDDGYDDIGGYR